MKKVIFLLFVSLIVCAATAQTPVRIEDSGITPSGHGASDGDVYLYQDWRVLNLVKKHTQINDNKFTGWRVQIYFGSGKSAPNQANDVKTKFLMKYAPKHDAYIVYEQPYFRVHVGDFRTRAEALKFKDVLSKMFPGSWVIQTEINYPYEANE